MPTPYQRALFERIFGGGHDINLPQEGPADPTLVGSGAAAQIPKVIQGGQAVNDLAAKMKAYADANKAALSPSMQGIVNAKGNQ